MSPAHRETDSARDVRTLHYHLTFLLAMVMLAVDALVSYASRRGPGFDAIRLGVLGCLALVAMIGYEIEQHRVGRPGSVRGFFLGAMGCLEVLLCLRTGGIASPYFLLVASTCVFAGLSLTATRAFYLATVLAIAYAGGIRFLSDPSPGMVDAAMVTALATNTAFLFIATSLATRFAKTHRRTVATLEVQSMSDPLTSLENRRSFLLKLEGELLRAERFSWPITMLVIDLDHFKRLNDVHGHAAGDQVLVEVAALLRETVGTLDHIARVGGEEFAIAAVAAEPYHGRDLADRLVRAFRNHNWDSVRPGIRLTCSIGVAVLPPGAREEDSAGVILQLMERADKALYRVKQSGRDGYDVSAESTTTPTNAAGA